MENDKKIFTHESLQETGQLSELLQALVKGLNKGKLTFTDENNEIVLSPGGLIRLNLNVTQHDTRNQLDLRLSWHSEPEKKALEKKLTIT